MDFPHPDRPTNATYSPGRTEKEMSFSTQGLSLSVAVQGLLNDDTQIGIEGCKIVESLDKTGKNKT